MASRNPVVFVPDTDAKWELVGATADQSARIQEHAYTVVNAPRPLPGPIQWSCWTEQFQHGTFYAAGDPTVKAEYGETLEQRWKALDAWPVALVTRAQVIEYTRREVERGSHTLAEYEQAGINVRDTVSQFDFVWHEAWSPEWSA